MAFTRTTVCSLSFPIMHPHFVNGLFSVSFLSSVQFITSGHYLKYKGSPYSKNDYITIFGPFDMFYVVCLSFSNEFK